MKEHFFLGSYKHELECLDPDQDDYWERRNYLIREIREIRRNIGHETGDYESDRITQHVSLNQKDYR